MKVKSCHCGLDPQSPRAGDRERWSTPSPLISIIVPVFNAAPYLERCIDSLLAQSYEHIEVVLVDDGSTDDSAQICDHYAAGDGRVTVIHQDNSGPMAACRQAILKSKGEYFCFVDSDDSVDRVMLSEMAARLGLEVPEIICANMTVEKAHGTVCELQGLSPGTYEADDHAAIFHGILGNEQRPISLSRCAKLISRELITENLSYCDDELRYGEDAVLILSALFDSRRIVVMAEAFFYHYYYHHTSAVHDYMPRLYEQKKLYQSSIRRVMEEKIKMRALDIPEAQINEQCGREHLFSLMLVLKNEARGNADGRSYHRNVREICHQENGHELARQHPLRLRQMSNRLLYMVLKHPCGMNICLLRLATKVFYAGK